MCAIYPQALCGRVQKIPSRSCKCHRAQGPWKNSSAEYALLYPGAHEHGTILAGFLSISNDLVFENAKSLDAGKLPPPNPKIFPQPTLLQVNSIPIVDHGRATLLFYDTAGEAFLRTQDIGRYAGFVRRAKTVLFLVSIPQLRSSEDSSSNPGGELERLLYSYIQGMADMNADTKDQHLIIVYTCADALLPELDVWPTIKQYILEDDWNRLTNVTDYVAQMYSVSDQLEKFTYDVLNAQQFMSLANSRFKSINFSIISALGAAPDESGQLAIKIMPRRILDPLFWTLERSLSARKRRKFEKRLMELPGTTAGRTAIQKRSPESKGIRKIWNKLFR